MTTPRPERDSALLLKLADILEREYIAAVEELSSGIDADLRRIAARLEALEDLAPKLLTALRKEHGPKGRHSGVMGDVGCCDWGGRCKLSKFMDQVETALKHQAGE